VNKDIETGARNLLLNCAEAKVGDRVLLVGEQCAAPFFDPRLCDDLAAACTDLGMESSIVLAEPGVSADHFPETVAQAMLSADITIFFSRLGDQLRFLESPGTSKKIMCYTLDRDHLASPFAGVDYRMMQRVHNRLLSRIKASKSYLIDAPNGTALSAELPRDTGNTKPLVTEFSLDLFPVMIFPPINFYHLNGQLVLEHFLTSSSTRAYADSVLMLDTPITVQIKDSRMVDFDGDADLIRKLRRQLERAASITGGDAWQLNSWHTGINPYTFFNGDPYRDLERWGTVAYGSPRHTHLHAAGKDPGDISIQLFDASIQFDDEILWDNGRFSYLDSDEVHALLSLAERELLNASVRLDIGL
jgi:hypothetical protein